MKKLFGLVLALILTLSLTACFFGELTFGPNGEKTQGPGGSTQGSGETTQSENNHTTSKPEENKINFTEIVAVDNDECTIKITGIDEDSFFGFTVKTQFVNKSADKTYMFTVEKASINGIQCSPLCLEEVSAGKKCNGKIRFSDDELIKNGIGDYTDIELSFHVYNNKDWSAPAVARETIRIYPYGEDKAVKYVRETQPSDTVLIDNEYVTDVVTGYEMDSLMGYTVKLFLMNKTDKNVVFNVYEASINGFMIDPFYSASLAAGKCEFGSMSWSDTKLEQNGITDIKEIEFKLRVFDADDWTVDDFAHETVTLHP